MGPENGTAAPTGIGSGGATWHLGGGTGGLCTSNRLPVLASEIRQANADIEQASAIAAEKALAVGNALIEAKALVEHGEWLPFLKEAGVHERTAQRFVTLAKSDLKSDTVSLLGGVTPALRFLRLRNVSQQHLREAETAAREGKTGDDELLRPLELALDIIGEMVAMFPPPHGTGGDAA